MIQSTEYIFALPGEYKESQSIGSLRAFRITFHPTLSSSFSRKFLPLTLGTLNKLLWPIQCFKISAYSRARCSRESKQSFFGTGESFQHQRRSIVVKKKQKTEKEEKREILERIVKDLHAGVPAEELANRFSALIESTSAEEIAEMESALIEKGFPVEEVSKLCKVHAQVFERALKHRGSQENMPGHPLYTFAQENKAALSILNELEERSKPLREKEPRMGAIASFAETFARFKEIEKHYSRKENQLFPALERKGFTGPSKVMWSKHDEIRSMIKNTESALRAKDWKELEKLVSSLKDAAEEMISLEEKILYPTASSKLDENDWAEIKRGEAEIGYAWITPSNLWDAELARKNAHESAPPNKSSEVAEHDRNTRYASTASNAIKLGEGALSPEQIDLMLKALPVDITFVDEADTVRYYSASEHRIFPRSPGIIGRKVQNCHPPKSVHIVNEIIESFRNKTKSVAEFWIQSQGKFIHIRYFPIYDSKGSYRGVIEMSQEVSGIRALEGERRILDW